MDAAGGAAAFLDRYDQIQPRQPVHARSHPPGATLLSRWTQDTVNPAAPSNAVRLLILSSLNLPVIFLMGRSIFDARTALIAAALFAAMPATIAFGTYSQDTVYAVLFNLYLLLSWQIARRDAARLLAVGAGVVLFLLSMLTFSWSIVAAGAFGFVLLSRLLRGLTLRSALPDAGLPPLTLLALHVATALLFHFDYYASYRESYAFHTRYYRFEGSADWTKAFFGGQLDWLWGMGPLVAGVFVGLLVRELVSRPAKPFHLFSLSVLACCGIAVVVGPNPLKLETARCWYWAMSFPVLGAAARLASGQRDMRPALLAVGCSLAAALISVSFLNFGA